MRSLVIRAVALLALTASSGAFLVANRLGGGGVIYETVSDSRLPLNFRVDSDPVLGVTSPIAVTQSLMNQWNAVPGTPQVFGVAQAGGSFNGSTARQTFGIFTNSTYEVAFDDDGSILAEYGLSSGVLGITLKIVEPSRGSILDVLVIINTHPGALQPPAGSGATREELFRGTLLHELGHVLGIGHSAVGMTASVADGLAPATAAQIPTLFPFRLPFRPQEGTTLELDDEAALRFRYANSAIGRGSISGTVRGISGAVANEIAVRAVTASGSQVNHIGVLSNGDGSGLGRFTIPGLPPGAYRVLIETVNGRGGVTSASLASSSSSIGSNPFVLAHDEFWQRGDTYDPARDAPGASTPVQVRADRDTGGIDFVLNARPIAGGATINGTLGNGDARVPDGSGINHNTDLFVFRGTVGSSFSIRVDGVGFTPQIGLYRPSNLSREAQAQPTFGSSATLSHTLEQSGEYTLGVSALGEAGTSAGRGNYSVRLTGTTLALAPAATVVPARIEPLALGPKQAGSPSCDVALLGMRAFAGSHEELWIDRLTVRGTGSGNERDHITVVRLTLDRNGNGLFDTGEPVVASTTFNSDNGEAVFDDMGLEIASGGDERLLVTYTVALPSVALAAAPLPAGLAGWWALVLLLPLLLARRQSRIGAVLALAILPLACGGGSGGGAPPPCFTEFNSDAASVTFQAEVRTDAVLAFSSVGDPPAPLGGLLAAPILSGTLTVSRAP